MKLVSACLLGINCAYTGKSNKCPQLIKKLKGKNIIPICPEQLGGLSTPRDRARIVGGDGKNVLDGKAKVKTFNDKDVTKEYLKGGREILKIAKMIGAKEAILKAYSPSCGCGQIFTEDFLGKKRGDGTTSALLKRNGIKVTTELDYCDE